MTWTLRGDQQEAETKGWGGRVTPAGGLLKEGFREVMAFGWLLRGFLQVGQRGLPIRRRLQGRAGCIWGTAFNLLW